MILNLRELCRLAEIGFLTPDETFEAMQTKRLPSKEESLEAQEEYKILKIRDCTNHWLVDNLHNKRCRIIN